MTMKRFMAIAMLAVSATTLPAQTRRPADSRSQCCSIAVTALQDVAKIKPGMKRADLAAMFTRDGGLDSLTQTTYVMKICPYIKIKVSFTLSNPTGQKESPSDVVKSVSDPYLQYPVMD